MATIKTDGNLPVSYAVKTHTKKEHGHKRTFLALYEGSKEVLTSGMVHGALSDAMVIGDGLHTLGRVTPKGMGHKFLIALKDAEEMSLEKEKIGDDHWTLNPQGWTFDVARTKAKIEVRAGGETVALLEPARRGVTSDGAQKKLSLRSKEDAAAVFAAMSAIVRYRADGFEADVEE